MTDEVNAFLVVLDKDIREDDAQPIISAIQQIRGVLTVMQRKSDLQSQISDIRARRLILEKIYDVLREDE